MMDDSPDMHMSYEQYARHCLQQQAKERHKMSEVIDNIRSKSAHDLLVLSGQIGKVPVDLKTLLEKLKISCKEFDFSEVEQMLYDFTGEPPKPILGAVVMNGNNAAILYRKGDGLDGHRYRFTIAHELAHCCLSHLDKSVHFRTEGDAVNAEEKAANIFAGELLIPKNELISIIHELILPSVHILAEIFAVSDSVMRARLQYLKVDDKIIGYNYVI